MIMISIRTIGIIISMTIRVTIEMTIRVTITIRLIKMGRYSF